MIALIPHCAFLSETSRVLAIAQALQARGERVVMATHGGPYTSLLEAAGMPVTRLAPTVTAEQCRAFVEGIIDVGNPRTVLQSAVEVRESVRHEVEFLHAVDAEMAVIGFSLTLYLSTRVAGIPLATSHGGSFVPPVFERGLAPTPTQAPAPFLDWLPARVLRWMANSGPPRMTKPVAFLNQIASELGVPPVPSLAAMMVGDLTLVTDTAEVLGIPADELDRWRPRTTAYRPETRLTYVGPLHARLATPVPPAVEPFLDGTRPTAYVALNSTTPAFIRRVVSGVRAAGMRVILSATIHDLGDLASPDVVVGGILPSHEIMPRVDLAVIMGGQGSVQTAICSGIPFLGFPLQPEQELNVAIGIRHGMALGIGPRRMTEDRVTAAVQRLQRDPSFRVGARRLQGMYAGIDGPTLAAEAISRYLAPARAQRRRGASAISG
jgi:UDP:flavonoid glycosyltransferase YjiC (YdhE family)